ncbi:hypothetical protein DP180_24230, partial [Enterobacter kobei]|uniref:cobalamin biosynthesis protein n=1 Tax=Enterobacter kobei TaxID=208224 RepID=UPI000DCB6447
RTAARDGRAHPSPNAGPVEAGFAAALGIRLGGRTVYASGAEGRVVMGSGPAPTVADLPRAIPLARRVGTVALAGARAGRLVARALRPCARLGRASGAERAERLHPG